MYCYLRGCVNSLSARTVVYIRCSSKPLSLTFDSHHLFIFPLIFSPTANATVAQWVCRAIGTLAEYEPNKVRDIFIYFNMVVDVFYSFI